MVEENQSRILLQIFIRKIEEAEASLSLAKDSLSEAKRLNFDWASSLEEEFEKVDSAMKKILPYVVTKKKNNQ
jgi:hypothetical protein